MNFRFAVPSDAEAFSRWAADNPQIDPDDILRARRENNPTVIFLVMEDENGKVLMFLPAYCSLRIAYLGFNPEIDSDERRASMEAMLPCLMGFSAEHGIREIDTLTRPEYPVAKWAGAHGFTPDLRSLYTLKFPPTKG